MKKKEKKDDVYFVHLEDTGVIRREILESLKLLLQFFQEFEVMRSLRHQKKEELSRLRKILKDINKSVKDLKQKFPQENIRLEPIRIHQHETEEAKPYSEVDKLSEELKSIEEKLRRLG